jgi:hypothetical protein
MTLGFDVALQAGGRLMYCPAHESDGALLFVPGSRLGRLAGGGRPRFRRFLGCVLNRYRFSVMLVMRMVKMGAGVGVVPLTIDFDNVDFFTHLYTS